MDNSKSYNPGACCGGHCFKYQWDEGPCWGDVEVIDEEWTEEDSWWIHSCQGHKNMYPEYHSYDGKYIEEKI
jgi:hypothetical protein